MKLMSLCVAPKISSFVTKLYYSMLASRSRIMMVRDTSITRATLIRTWPYVNGGIAACDNMWDKNLLHKLMTFCLRSVLTLRKICR